MNLEVEGSKISGSIMFDRGSFGWMVISVYQADYCTPQDADECILFTLTHHTRHSIKKARMYFSTQAFHFVCNKF
jgi:hypothetical protein